MKAFMLMAGIIGAYAIGGVAAHAQCKGSPAVTGVCSTVHGRLFIANGIPVRIWVVGTHHVLAAVDLSPHPADAIDAAPPSVRRLLLSGQPGAIVVYGDYEVCPLEKYRPGHMQAVCIKSAAHLAAGRSAAN